jgi:hypothetical protein
MKPMWKKIISHIVGENTDLFVNMVVLVVLIIIVTGMAGAYIAITLARWPEFASVGIGFEVTILVILGVLEIIQMSRTDERDNEIKQITTQLDLVQDELIQIRQMQ